MASRAGRLFKPPPSGRPPPIRGEARPIRPLPPGTGPQARAELPAGFSIERGGECSVEVGIHDFRVDITLPAHGSRIPKTLCHRFNGSQHVAFRLRLRIECRHFVEGSSRQHGASPGTKILGGELVAGDRLR